MMNDYGRFPGEILRSLADEGRLDPMLSYSCCACGNCMLACPKSLPMRDVFLNARKDFVRANGGRSPIPGHRSTEFHQFFSFSRPFTSTVPGQAVSGDEYIRRGFLAGCSLSSSSPEEVGKTVNYLQSVYPGLSAVQKCCGMPTKNMGQEELFRKRFASLQEDLDRLNIEELIVACQNCKKIIDRYGTVRTRSLWEVLPEIGIPEEMRGKGRDSEIVFTIHDSCPTREERGIHDGIRWLMQELGYRVIEAEDSREKTRCCGAGGMAGDASPEVTRRIIQKRLETLPSENVVVYCGTCRSNLAAGGANVWHILDLLWGPVVHAGDVPPENVLASTASAWKNRYVCKSVLRDALAK